MAGAEIPSGVQVSYSQQYRRCGKTGCTRCAAGGRGHGPYWYATWWEGGRPHSCYLGKHAPLSLDGTPESAVEAGGEPLRVRTLGGFAVWRGAALLAPESWASRRARALFLCLLSTPGQRLHREQASELLWPEAAPEAGAANLRTTIRLLRRVLDVPGATVSHLRSEGEMLVLAPAGRAEPPDNWLDAAAFARAARAALAGQDVAACRAALELYGGDYLPDEPYAAWAEQPRASLRRQYVDLLLHLATLSGGHGDVDEAEDCLRRVLGVEPSEEGAAATLMSLLAASGRRGEALQVYQRLATVLEEDLDVAPSAEITALRARLQAQEAAPRAVRAPPRRDTPARLTNLPLALTSFVGRTWEMAAVVEALDAARLLTLTGPGGCGKTRLALAVAEQHVEGYPDGVWLVELAALADPAQVPRALAGALGLVEGAGRSVHDALVDALRPRHALVLLDNCEHLIGACAELATVLLQRCPHLRLLATSRERLEVAGEQTYLVPSLAVPDPAHLPVLAQLATYEAVQLFVERARARRPDLILTAANAGAVAQICARLDGLPLAIELAAARSGAMAVADVAARLDDRFRLLTGGPRTALPRQQTLRATLEWSHDLLAEPERVVLRRLAVFAGGCTLEAAEAVCADVPAQHPQTTSAVGGEAMVELMSRLVQKSLVQFEEPRGEARYRLLETVRQYGLERLVVSSEEATLRQRHAAYFFALAEQASTRQSQAEQILWFEQAAEEQDNLRGALRWFLDDGQGEQVLRLAVLLGPFWFERCHYAEGKHWLEEALAACPGAPTRLRARGYHYASLLALFRGDWAGAAALGDEAVRLLRSIGERAAIPWTHTILIGAATQQGDHALALRHLEEAEALCHEFNNKRGLANILQLSGQVALNQGDYERAVVRLEESVAITRAHGPRRFLVHSLDDLARALLCRGELWRAIPQYAEGLQIAWEWRERQMIAYYLEGFACTAAQQGHPTRAACLAGAAHALRQEVSSPISAPEEAFVERFLAPARAALDAAAWDGAWNAGATLPLDQAVAYASQGSALDTTMP